MDTSFHLALRILLVTGTNKILGKGGTLSPFLLNEFVNDVDVLNLALFFIINNVYFVHVLDFLKGMSSSSLSDESFHLSKWSGCNPDGEYLGKK